MKVRILAFVAVGVLSLLIGGSAQAQCNDGPSGYSCGFLGCWWDYTEGSGCYSTYGSVSSATACTTSDGWEFGTGGTQYATYTFDVTDAGRYFEVGSDITFLDPNNNANNAIILDAYVLHPNNTANYYQLFAFDGTDGDLSCYTASNTFYAANGDQVTISVNVGKQNSNTTIVASVPTILAID